MGKKKLTALSGAKTPGREHQTISYEILRVLPCPKIVGSGTRVEIQVEPKLEHELST